MKIKTQNLPLPMLFMLVLTMALPARTQYKRYRMNILENGGFEYTDSNSDVLGAYWLNIGRGDIPAVPSDLITDLDVYEGQYALYLNRGDTVWQYLPGVQEYADSLVIRGALKLINTTSSARLHMKSAEGKKVIYCFQSHPDPPQNDSLHTYIGIPTPIQTWTSFTLPAGTDFFSAFGENASPRFTIILEGGADYCLFDALEITTDFYTLSPEQLKEAILNEMEWTFDLWIEYGLDRAGPESTSCVSYIHDALTGEEVQTLTLCPVWASYPLMIEYLKFRENSQYRQLVIDQANLFLKTIHRTSGLMQYWDPVLDQPAGGTALLPLSYFWQVYDLTGDTTYSKAAISLTDSILSCAQRAWLTESIQPGYLQSGFKVDGTINNLHENQYQIMIRWFDVAKILAETYEREPRPQYLEAMENCAQLYITPSTIDYADIDPETITFDPTWYSWINLIPAFDDYFGYGIQGLWKIWVAGGFTHANIEAYLKKAFADMGTVWRKAMLGGGREAGDETRGWLPFFWMWQHDPEGYQDHQELLIRNGYTVMKGEFGEYGSWMGTGYEDWSPIIGLPGEGATTGASGTALMGLYLAWEASGRNEDLYAAMVTLFRTSQLTYKFDYGYIRTPTPDPNGPNLAGGEFRYLNVWFLILEALGFTDLKNPDATPRLPQGFKLYLNYPNPFNPVTSIRYTIPHSVEVKLTIFNLSGQTVKTLQNTYQNAGTYTIQWNGRNDQGLPLASGMYICKIQAGDFSKVLKLLLIK